MIILSVIIGYVLGVMPFLFFYAVNKRNTKIIEPKEEKAINATEEIINEWLNGEPKEEPVKQTSQKIMYDEILTGVSNGGKE